MDNTLNMANERRLIFGNLPGADATCDPFSYDDDPITPMEARKFPVPDSIFDGVVVVPVLARPWVETRSNGWIDNSAEILVGDIPDTMSMTPFERTQADYNGIDTRGTPIVDFDEVSGEMYL